MFSSRFLLSFIVIWLLRSILHANFAKKNTRRTKEGLPMDPIGGNKFKEFVGRLMAKIARIKEGNKSTLSFYDIENWHKPQVNPFFNESHYLNGIGKNRERVISRISHRGEKGDVSYIFITIFHPELGILSVEKDNVQLSAADSAKSNSEVIAAEAQGMRYECIEPMEKWKLTYKGKMKLGCNFPTTGKEDEVEVELELIYSRTTRIFWYMRDDHPITLAKNLSQAPWGLNFLKYCLKRSDNHGHYEDYGTLTGKVNNKVFRMESFRDHSWDIRNWAGMDKLFILLTEFVTPLNFCHHEYKYLNLTLVDMPGNPGGVMRWSGGYILSEDRNAPILKLKCGTSINDIGCIKKDKRRIPLPELSIELVYCNEKTSEEIVLDLSMSNLNTRLQYWPDNGFFEVFEDDVDFVVTTSRNKTIKMRGTRQMGFRVGDFDPTFGGVG